MNSDLIKTHLSNGDLIGYPMDFVQTTTRAFAQRLFKEGAIPILVSDGHSLYQIRKDNLVREWPSMLFIPLTNKQFGMKVTVTFNNGNTETYRNATEVHDNAPLSGTILAIESDIHQTGKTFPVSDIKEFEVVPETSFAPNF